MKGPSYVRTEMLAQQTPPLTERGAVKWLRENLFSNWLNAIISVLLGIVIVALVVEAIVWAYLDSHWKLASLAECRAANEQLPTRIGFQFYEILLLPWILIQELLAGLFQLDIVRAFRAPGNAIEMTWTAMNEAPESAGACWAMVKDRWHQFLFGFYPRELFWRPVLALGLLLISLAPVLYFGLRRVNLIMVGSVAGLTLFVLILLDQNAGHLIRIVALLGGLTALAWFAPKRLIILTMIYPLLGFWLLWGGSVWGPVGVAMGFGLLVMVYTLAKPLVGVIVATGAGFVAAAIWWLTLQTGVTTALHAAIPYEITGVTSDKFGGFLLAFVIGVTAIGASLPVGIMLALGRRSDMMLIKTLCVGFIEFVRGVPLITVLFTATLLLGYFLPPQSNFDVVLRVIILVTFFSAAYLAEVIRGGLASLPKGQYEAADALGLDYWQAQRLIIMPQALKVSIPNIVSSFIGLFKDTTLVAFVGLMDPLKGVTTIVRADTAWKGIYWEPYIFVGGIFFVVCFGMSRYSMYLERKLKTDHR